MNYEISNIIFRHKPTASEMKRKYPFRRLKEQVYLIKDTTRNLYRAYANGFTIKPHPFNKATIQNAQVHAIVLDFDHLTPLQKDFIGAIVNGKYRFSDIYGDYSAGTKTRLYDNRDIPDYRNPKWGYKVFYPADCLCTWQQINEAFIEAVSFFNPLFGLDEVRTIWDKWLKANNHKGINGIDNPIFKDWILPDVAMLNSFRTQITYSVRPEFDNDKIVPESVIDRNRDFFGLAKFPCGGKQDYDGLDWRPEEAIAYKDTDVQTEDKWYNIMATPWETEYNNALNNEATLRLTIPTTRSQLARSLNRPTFEDLAWDDKLNSLLNSRIWAKGKLDRDLVKVVAADSARTLTRNLLELEYQRDNQFDLHTVMRDSMRTIIHDVLCVVRQRCGLKVLRIIRSRELAELRRTTFRAILLAAHNFRRFRARLKLKLLEQEWNPPHLRLLEEYIATKDKAKLSEYNTQRATWLKTNVDRAFDLKCPYTYRKRGLKQELISLATFDVDGIDVVVFGGPVRMETEAEWVEWCKSQLMRKSDDMITVNDSDLKRWYKDYRKEYNAKYCQSDNTELYGKQIRKRGKYDELFKDMDKEQISRWIDSADIHRQQKKRLRQKYL